MIELRVFKTDGEISAYTFAILTETAAAVNAGRNKPAAALSFGSTYNSIFRKWSELYRHNPGVGLPAFFPVDERLVDINNAGSNWRAARKLFIDECGTPEDGRRWASNAATYRDMLEEYFGSLETRPDPEEAFTGPIFDLMFLGMGPDGHTASLFPANMPKETDPAWHEPVLQTTAPFDPPNRLTLGPAVIGNARRMFITVTGGGKAEIFRELMAEADSIAGGKGQPAQPGPGLLPPAGIIIYRERLGLKTEVLCDETAAAKLDANTKKYRVIT